MSGNPPKQLSHIVADFSTRLHEHDLHVSGHRLALLGGDEPLVEQVRLVADEQHNHVGAALAAHVLHPPGGPGEGARAGDVVHHDGGARVPDVGRDERAEALLARRVPDLQTHGALLQVHGLGQEVHADGGLVRAVEAVVHEPGDDGRLAHVLLAQEHYLELFEGSLCVF